MSNSLFGQPQEVFLDVVDAQDYVQLDRISIIYQSLKDAVKKPLKMILVYGKPGTGKSMMLNKLAHDLAKEQKVVIYQTPIVDEKEFHDMLLSQGSIALPLVVQSVFGESVWQSVHDEIFTD